MAKIMKLCMIFLLCLLCWSFAMATPAWASEDTSAQYRLTSDQDKAEIHGFITYTMRVKGFHDLYAYEAKFHYDSSKLEFHSAVSNLDGFSVSPIHSDSQITIAHTKLGSEKGESGDFAIGTLVFKVKSAGLAEVNWDTMKIVDHNLSSQSVQVASKVTIAGAGLVLTDIQDHWAAVMIKEAVERGIVNGFDDGSFHPDDAITRAQFAAMLARALQLKEEGAPDFVDADRIPDWVKSEIGKAVKAGIIDGYEDRSFRAEQAVSRSEIAVMVARAMKLAEENGALAFADNAIIPDWAKGWVAAAVREGLVEGRSNQEFAPNDRATRAEAVVLVLRMLRVG